jgi:hypothetical protein
MTTDFVPSTCPFNRARFQDPTKQSTLTYVDWFNTTRLHTEIGGRVQSQGIAAKLKAAGLPVKIVLIAGGQHGLATPGESPNEPQLVKKVVVVLPVALERESLGFTDDHGRLWPGIRSPSREHSRKSSDYDLRTRFAQLSLREAQGFALEVMQASARRGPSAKARRPGSQNCRWPPRRRPG